MQLLNSSDYVPGHDAHLDFLNEATEASTFTDTLEATQEYYPTWKQPIHLIILYTVVYSTVFLLGVLGNTLVILVVYCNPQMHNVTNYFIVNLAVADMLVGMFVLPITLVSNLLSGWHFGPVMCKLTPFLQGVAVSASGSTLSAIAIDRYLAICHVMKFHVTRKMARLVIFAIWIIAVTAVIPWAVFYRLEDSSTSLQVIYVCNQFWPSEEQKKGYFLGIIVVMCYTLPLVLITCFYTLVCRRVWYRKAPGTANDQGVVYRSKVNVLKMLIVVVILFACAWLPLYAVNMRIYFGPPIYENPVELEIIHKIIIPISQWLGASNSCVNPIVYCLFSNKFRTGMKLLVTCRRAKLKPQNQSMVSAATRPSCAGLDRAAYALSSRSPDTVHGGPDTLVWRSHGSNASVLGADCVLLQPCRRASHWNRGVEIGARKSSSTSVTESTSGGGGV